MYTKSITISLLTALLSFTTATPLAADIRSRQASVYAHVNMYDNELCTDTVQQFDKVGSGGELCVAVDSAKSSVSASGTGCTVYAWSGTNCEGGSSIIPQEDGCHTLQYGSVSVTCP